MAEEARRSLHELSAEVATNPDSTAFVELAAAYRERGDIDRALRLCLRGIQRHPTHVEAHFELGRIYEAQGERELALDEWGIVRQLAPDHLPTRLALIRLYLDESRVEDAEAELRVARKLAPSNGTLEDLIRRLQAKRAEAGPGDVEAWKGEAGEADGGAATGAVQDPETREAPAPEAKPPERDPFEALQAEYPGVVGLLVTDGEGRLLAGRMTRRGEESDRMLAATLAGAKGEADRVAKYLDLGAVRGIVVESAVARLTVSLVERGLVIVATTSDVAPGQAVMVVERAGELAAPHLGGGGG